MAAHEDLMAAAVAQTGIGDFGDDSFREGLEILLRSLREEARLNAAGEAFLYPRIVGHLAQRLQVEDWYRRHPEIDDVPIEALHRTIDVGRDVGLGASLLDRLSNAGILPLHGRRRGAGLRGLP